ncbi:MAG: hypothetical protein IK141_03805 [Clostridia bacterium]|nr:hypothetical protein [Clostridia bacterium]
MAWTALRWRGAEYTAPQLIDAAKRFAKESGCVFQAYEIYDDCELLMISALDEAGESVGLELPLDDLPVYLNRG